MNFNLLLFCLFVSFVVVGNNNYSIIDRVVPTNGHGMTAVSPPPPPPPSLSSSMQNGAGNLGFVKVKCPRSKSQPAFKDSAQLSAINSVAALGFNNNNSKSNSTTTNGDIYSNLNGVNGIYSAHTNATNSNINKYLSTFADFF